MQTLNIIGAGRLGQSLGRLFRDHQQYAIQNILTRSAASAVQAREFIGQGEALYHFAQLQPADVNLIAVPDDQIAAVVADPYFQKSLTENALVFHCSGSKSSALLNDLRGRGVSVASVHPICSFADPAQVVLQFSGTLCTIEGDMAAKAKLLASFQALGARLFEIDVDQKLLYHAASVFASNYLVSLMDVAIAAFVGAGLEQALAIEMTRSLAEKTMHNAFELGCAQALTGPIRRGDMQTVVQQQACVEVYDAVAGQLYQAFIAPTVALKIRAEKERLRP